MEVPPKRLTRSMNNKVLAGVCGGLGEYFNIDPLVIRIVFVVIAFWGGSGVLLYLIMWLIIPVTGKETASIEQSATAAGQEMKERAQDMAREVKTGRWNAGVLLGAMLILIGLSSIANMYLPWRIFRWDTFWPALVIVLGLALIFKRK